MFLTARVLESNRTNLLVEDLVSEEQIFVHTSCAPNFAPGEIVRITYDGRMTLSIPPQITASSIQSIDGGNHNSNCGNNAGNSSTMRAVIMQSGNGFLIVRNLQDNQQYRVQFAQAHHFCARQRVTIDYKINPYGSNQTITATDITPIC